MYIYIYLYIYIYIYIYIYTDIYIYVPLKRNSEERYPHKERGLYVVEV